MLVLGITATNLAWLRHFRAVGGPVDIDEASYLTIALQTTRADHNFLRSPVLLWQNSAPQAPLLGLVTAPFQYVFGRTIEVSYLANLPFVVLLIVAAYLLGRRFSTW